MFKVKFGLRSKALVSVEEIVEPFTSATTSNARLVSIHDVTIGEVFAEEFQLMANSEDAPRLHTAAEAPNETHVYVYIDGGELKPCI